MIDERTGIDFDKEDEYEEKMKVLRRAKLVNNVKHYAIKAAPLVLPVLTIIGMVAIGNKWVKDNDVCEKVEKQERDINVGPFYSGEVDMLIGDTGWYAMRNVEVCPDQISEDLANGRFKIV